MTVCKFNRVRVASMIAGMKHRWALALLLALTACDYVRADAPTTAPTSQPTYTRQANVIYGRSWTTALTMDVFTPTGGKQNGAAVILVVSGGWVSNVDGLSSPLFKAFYEPYCNRGFTVFAVTHGSQPKFTIPEIRLDLNRGVRYIRYHAKDYGIDPDRIGITGASAGGHLSLLQGCGPLPPNDKAPDPVDRVESNIQAVACLFPPTDFLNWGKEGVNVLDTENMAPFMAAFDFRVMDPKTHMFERLPNRAAVAEVEKEISPIYHVTHHSPPTLIIQGDADTLVPMQQSELFVERMKAAHAPMELSIKKGGGHGWLDMKPDMEKMVDWFEKYLVKENSK
jgi:acetyl esterase/lipase